VPRLPLLPVVQRRPLFTLSSAAEHGEEAFSGGADCALWGGEPWGEGEGSVWRVPETGAAGGEL